MSIFFIAEYTIRHGSEYTYPGKSGHGFQTVCFCCCIGHHKSAYKKQGVRIADTFLGNPSKMRHATTYVPHKRYRYRQNVWPIAVFPDRHNPIIQRRVSDYHAPYGIFQVRPLMFFAPYSPTCLGQHATAIPCHQEKTVKILPTFSGLCRTLYGRHHTCACLGLWIIPINIISKISIVKDNNMNEHNISWL